MNEDAHSAWRNDLTVTLVALELVEAEPTVSAELRHVVGAARERLLAAVHRLEVVGLEGEIAASVISGRVLDELPSPSPQTELEYDASGRVNW